MCGSYGLDTRCIIPHPQDSINFPDVSLTDVWLISLLMYGCVRGKVFSCVLLAGISQVVYAYVGPFPE